MPRKRAMRRRRKTVPKSVKKYVKAKINNAGETKYIMNYPAVISPTWDTSTTTAISVFDIPQGDGEAERIGLKIEPKSLRLAFTAYRGLTDCTLRLVIFRYTDRLNSNPIQDTVLEIGGTGSVQCVNMPYQINKINRQRFNILHDSSYILDDGRQNAVHREINLSLKYNPIYFADATATAGKKNNIYFMFFADVATANAPTLSYNILRKWKDL